MGREPGGRAHLLSDDERGGLGGPDLDGGAHRTLHASGEHCSRRVLRWQYGSSWLEVATNLKGIATDALEAGRVLRDRLVAIGAQASQSAEAWENR